MAGKHLFPSGKGRKRPEISENRYSGFLWEQDVAGSNPVIPTKEKAPLAVLFLWLMVVDLKMPKSRRLL